MAYRHHPHHFWDRVQKSAGCWLWTGARSNGYGRLLRGGRSIGAHRYAYEALVGPIPSGLQLDHLCRNPLCVNPAHLEPVTKDENNRRGFSPSAIHARKTECPKGHPYTEANTYRHGAHGRRCRICTLQHNRQRALRRAVLENASHAV